MKQKTLLNLGKHVDIDPANWNLLALRISQIVYGEEQEQKEFFDSSQSPDKALEIAAQRYAALVL